MRFIKTLQMWQSSRHPKCATVRILSSRVTCGSRRSKTHTLRPTLAPTVAFADVAADHISRLVVRLLLDPVAGQVLGRRTGRTANARRTAPRPPGRSLPALRAAHQPAHPRLDGARNAAPCGGTRIRCKRYGLRTQQRKELLWSGRFSQPASP
jgi:hypothetical protein